MDEDVEMDAPQISILREEESPPPQRKTASSRKSKPTPKAKTGEFPFLPRPRKESISDDEYDEPEEEEDQLIDDDDDELNKPTPTQTPVKPTEAGQKRKAPSKRKPRKAEKKIEEDKKAKEKQPLQVISQTNIGVPETEPPQPDITGDAAVVDVAHDNVTQDMPIEPSPIPKPPAPSKKKATPRKPPAAPRQRAKLTNEKEKLKITIRHVPQLEDMDVASEGGHTGTAASSPIATHIEPIDPYDLDLDRPAPTSSIPAPEEPLSLENVPIPIYPLPTKPFPVQPPSKMNTGAAPTIPLDKSGKKVRHWRVARREIRGIAGGRWFARTWVGEKESQFAAHIAAVGKEGDDRPKGSSASAPVAGKGSTKTKGSKNASLVASASASAAPSRDASLGPDVPVSISTVRAPTKMRMAHGPSEYVD
ncbi:hypothetical protein AX15_001339 [Amanita polypyramis BW_CC]|nr:hypothetical protein AX15_001339 [Amanita polypyramis BW_CC]